MILSKPVQYFILLDLMLYPIFLGERHSVLMLWFEIEGYAKIKPECVRHISLKGQATGGARLAMAIDPHIAHQFDAAGYREHNIVVYNDIDTFRELYCRSFKQALERDNEIVLMASYYEPVFKVKEMLQEHDIDVSKHENNGSLLIIDAVEGYQTAAGHDSVLKLSRSLAARAKKEGKNGVFNFSDMGSFFLANKEQPLVEYELSVPKILDVPLKAFCCYHRRDFERLTERQRQTLLTHHNRAINAAIDG